jgi:hypothetical protein
VTGTSLPLAIALAEVGAVLAAATLVGWGAAGALLPRSAGRGERFAWSFATGVTLIALSTALAFAMKIRPGWLPFLLVCAAVALPSRLLRVRGGEGPAPEARRPTAGEIVLSAVVVAGVLLYALRALTEPMWSNDFIAIWGLKGKTFFAEGRIPQRLFQWPAFKYSHPEYPLGLPFLYAGIAALVGRWDDHAMALIFPLTQAATLAGLFGWLRGRGVDRGVALGAAALVSQFEPLYAAYGVGMADVPLSFGALLLGAALSDRVDRTDRVASRRLALASLVCAATKNEGLFLVAAGLVVAALSSLARRGVVGRAAAVVAVPAALVAAAHRLIRGSRPLSDFDFSLLRRPGELLPRIGESIAAVVGRTSPAAWLGVAAIVVLLVVGKSVPAGNRLLVLAGCALAAYLFLPALAVAGPAWLVETAFFRTTAALAPLAAAGVAVRLTVVGKRETENGKRTD